MYARSSVDDVRRETNRFIGFTPTLASRLEELESFLRQNLYLHPRVVERNEQAVPVIGDLFRSYRADLALLPAHVRARFAADGETRAVADYIAGMTDRFAQVEHRRLAERR